MVVMKPLTLRAAQDWWSEHVARAEHEHDDAVVTREESPTAAVVRQDHGGILEETLQVLCDADALRGLAASLDAISQGDVRRGVAPVRQLRPSP